MQALREFINILSKVLDVVKERPYVATGLTALLFTLAFLLTLLLCIVSPNQTLCMTLFSRYAVVIVVVWSVIIVALAALSYLQHRSSLRASREALVPAINISSRQSVTARYEYSAEGPGGQYSLKLALSPAYRYLGRLLDVLAEERVLSVRDIEELLSREGIVLDLIGQERGVWPKEKREAKTRIINIVARRYGVDSENITNLFGLYMMTEARKVLGEYEPLVARVNKIRLYGTSEYIVLLRKGVSSSEELSQLLLRLAQGYKHFATTSLKTLVHNPGRYGEDVADVARKALESLERISPEKLLLPPYDQDHPTVIAVVPFRYSLEILGELGKLLGGDNEVSEALLSEVGRILRSKPVLGGLKLRHLLMAAGCRHENTLRKLSHIEDNIVRDLGYKNILDLILSENEPHKAILNALSEKYPEHMRLIREHCGNSLNALQDLLGEIQNVMKKAS